MIKTIAVIEGDDAAPEAMQPVVKLLDSMNIGLEWVYRGRRSRGGEPAHRFRMKPAP